jgi:K+-transporting ATPase KdpF subunit
MVTRDVSVGPCSVGALLSVPESVRAHLNDEVMRMIYVTAIIVLFLFVYLLVALIRPEWF